MAFLSPESTIPPRPLPVGPGVAPAAFAAMLSLGAPAAAAWTSRSITRPPGPLPTSRVGSIPCLAARFFARGLTPPVFAAPSIYWVSCATAGETLDSGTAAGAADPALAVVPLGRNAEISSPAFPIAAIWVSTGMSAPSSKKSSSTTPAAGASMSNEDLSVSMLPSHCPSMTASPFFTCHETRMQLSTDWPNRGMRTGVAMAICS